jgi:diguanylate cyclase (GGDEF)-like protein
LALLACLVLLVVLYVRLSRSRRRLRSRLRAANSQLDQLRGRDALTGLLTRPDFELALDGALQSAGDGDTALAVLYLGLDNFRPVNEAYGHEAGDAVLQQIAKRIRALVGPDGAAARLAGDEFVLLVQGPLGRVDEQARRLVQAAKGPFKVKGYSVPMSASVGVALYPDHGARPRLLANAAQAMRSVKLGGGDGHTCWDPSMNVDLRGQAELVQDLKHAVARGELQLVFQPKVDARSREVTAAEALLRWQHPQRGMVSPGVFIPLAERYGLIGGLGEWVIQEACRHAAEWRGQGLRMRVAVNLSALQLRQDKLVPFVLACLRQHGISPGRLTCEVTESVAMEDTEQTRRAFDRLRKAGLHVSIDDFGTGQTALAWLQRLPVAELKIDRSFVTDVHQQARSQHIVSASGKMAHALNLRVVAEGVETEAQRHALVELGCDELQGFLFARPMSARDLALWASDARSPAQREDSDATGFRASLFEATAPVPLDEPVPEPPLLVLPETKPLVGRRRSGVTP